MSWLPTLELDFWNAWILTLVILLHPLILLVVDKVVGTGDIFKKMGEASTDKREKRENAITLVILILLIAYSIFLPLQAGTAWFYGGLTIWLGGLVIFITAIVNVATTPLNQVFRKGIYRFSRHPLYTSQILIFLGVSVVTASWVYLLLTIVFSILLNSQAVAEERSCRKSFGDEYRDYMAETSRWLGIPKSR